MIDSGALYVELVVFDPRKWMSNEKRDTVFRVGLGLLGFGREPPRAVGIRAGPLMEV